MIDLPAFNFEGYKGVIQGLLKAGYKSYLVDEMPSTMDAKALYLRHDIDLHLYKVDNFASLEVELEVFSTYFVLLTGPYNPLERRNVDVIRRISDLGHAIGLHYDLEMYPADYESARQRLVREVEVLEDIVGKEVRSIVRHQPYKGGVDPFMEDDFFVHPHNPRYGEGLMYISDSCRAWRDLNILRCVNGQGSRRLLFATHPELWLGGGFENRHDYMRDTIVSNCSHFAHDYCINEMNEVWKTHDAVVLHEARVRGGV